MSIIAYTMKDNKNCFPLTLQFYYQKLASLKEFAKEDPQCAVTILFTFLTDNVKASIDQDIPLCPNSSPIFFISILNTIQQIYNDSMTQHSNLQTNIAKDTVELSRLLAQKRNGLRNHSARDIHNNAYQEKSLFGIQKHINTFYDKILEK